MCRDYAFYGPVRWPRKRKAVSTKCTFADVVAFFGDWGVCHESFLSHRFFYLRRVFVFRRLGFLGVGRAVLV